MTSAAKCHCAYVNVVKSSMPVSHCSSSSCAARWRPRPHITTPGRLFSTTCKAAPAAGRLEHTESWRLLDEADRMLDMGFINEQRSRPHRGPHLEGTPSP